MPDSSAVLKKLGETEKKYCSLEELLALPETFSNIPLYTSTMKEYRSLTPVITRYRDYMRMSSEAEEAEALSQDSSDPELRAMAAEELYDLREKLSALENELTGMLLARDPNDDRNVVVEIRAGAGGEEACLFAAVLYRMYSMYCEKSGFRISVADANETGLGGFRALTFTVEGEHIPASNLNRVYTAFSAYLRPNLREEYRPPPLRWRSFPRRTMLILKYCLRTLNLKPANQAERADSISTKQNPP